jgi:hypothetical protein
MEDGRWKMEAGSLKRFLDCWIIGTSDPSDGLQKSVTTSVWQSQSAESAFQQTPKPKIRVPKKSGGRWKSETIFRLLDYWNI